MVNLSVDKRFLSSQARSLECDLSNDESFEMGLIIRFVFLFADTATESTTFDFFLAASDSVCSPKNSKITTTLV